MLALQETVSIPAEELEELFISKKNRNDSLSITGSKPKIIAVSDSKQISFGTASTRKSSTTCSHWQKGLSFLDFGAANHDYTLALAR
jgi:hypothetical protein